MLEEANRRVFYAGAFTRPLDEKRRFTIPAKWRGDSFLAMPNTYGAITVLPPEMVEKIYEAVSKVSLANPQKRRAISLILERSEPFGCDKQGRVMLGEEILAHAGIEREARVVGVGSTFEIWNPKRRDEWAKQGGPVDLSSALEELGI